MVAASERYIANATGTMPCTLLARTGEELSQKANAVSKPKVVVHFDIAAPHIEPDHVLVVAGSAKPLGSWQPEHGAVMRPGLFPRWYTTVVLDASDMPVE